VIANFAGRKRERVIGTDSERDGVDDERDGADDGRADRSERGDPRLGAVAFALTVLVASLIPVSWIAPGGGSGTGIGAGGPLPLGIGLTDPFHLVGYAILTVLASRAIGRGRLGLLLAVGVAVAFGFGIELVQAPIPWRSFAWRDAAVNAVGAAIGAVALAVIDALVAGDALDATRG
jgi:hypothetical protein